jgi:hypothetical protein
MWHAYLRHSVFLNHTNHESLAHLSDQCLHNSWQHKCMSSLWACNIFFPSIMGMSYRIVYKKRSKNCSCDILLSPLWDGTPWIFTLPTCLYAIGNAYKRDIMLVNYYKDDQVTLRDGVLRDKKKSNMASFFCQKKSRIWRPVDWPLQKVIQELHASSLCGHWRILVTLWCFKHLFLSRKKA